MLRQAALSGAEPTRPLTLLASGWFLSGVGSYGVSVLTWLHVLRDTPLSIATPFIAIVYVAVPLVSRPLFGDVISLRMALGMFLVVAGVTLVGSETWE